MIRIQNIKYKSATLEQQKDLLANIEIDEVFGFMGDKASKVLANKAMPGGLVVLVTLLFDEAGHVLFVVVVLQGVER